MSDTFRTGYAALVGRPNAGKSTLMNNLLGGKLAIISAKPQTTRNRIRGILNQEDSQIILVDTPGIHDAHTELNKVMVKGALSAIDDCDVVIWLCDMTTLAKRVKKQEDFELLDAVDELIANALVESGTPVILAANKMDVIAKELVLPVIEALSARVPLIAAVPISALKGLNVEALKGEIVKHMPVHPPVYPTDQWTELSERFLTAEVIREKLFHLTEQEIPYATFVEVESFDEEERDTPRNLTKIHAKIVVERDSQKGIVIGKRGSMLKRIGTDARKELETLLDCKVFLKLFVKVEKDWSKTSKGLRRVGFELDS
ncbi:MAG: GTP-binding protein Era [Myxococcota bacterium]|jgi:GTP-binding protein Era